jgi:carbamoyl-phosphate synthase/aspartate carbamoyltransferase
MTASGNRISQANAVPFPPVTARPVGSNGEMVTNERLATLELEDGSAYQGYSFGAEKTVSGELVFQTGIAEIDTNLYQS